MIELESKDWEDETYFSTPQTPADHSNDPVWTLQVTSQRSTTVSLARVHSSILVSSTEHAGEDVLLTLALHISDTLLLGDERNLAGSETVSLDRRGGCRGEDYFKFKKKLFSSSKGASITAYFCLYLSVYVRLSQMFKWFLFKHQRG